MLFVQNGGRYLTVYCRVKGSGIQAISTQNVTQNSEFAKKNPPAEHIIIFKHRTLLKLLTYLNHIPFLICNFQDVV